MSQNVSMHKVDIPNLKKTCFVIENLLSPEECKYLINQSEQIGYSSIETEFLSTVRDNKRILIISQELSELLFNRIKLFIEEIPDLGTTFLMYCN